MAQRHIVGRRTQCAPARNHHVALFPRDQVDPQQEPAVRLAMGHLQHFALAAAAGPFVHDVQRVVIGCYHLYDGAVGGHPALALAKAQQAAIDPFLGARPWIQVIGENLVGIGAALMNHYLLSVKIGVAEGRRDVNQ
ncbi:MAG: hypothetical protein BWX80_02690 [Candidatus Hydrogenedentes bacterium ADurb.Bin101]|nr:MAG: hypothetical protein BWX80_02690 [Candidatus Hydrogenedentes bacterium ADurb.Bin101]